MIGFIDNRPKDQPFFGYLAFSAPHFPLQAPPEKRANYIGKYDDGPDALRARRLARMKEVGIIDRDVQAHPVVVSAKSPEVWDDLTPEERKLSSGAQETFSGMVETIDDCVGSVVERLKETGDLDSERLG